MANIGGKQIEQYFRLRPEMEPELKEVYLAAKNFVENYEDCQGPDVPILPIGLWRLEYYTLNRLNHDMLEWTKKLSRLIFQEENNE